MAPSSQELEPPANPARFNLKDKDFNTENYKPGTSGEAKLRNDFIAQLFD
jgi:hypothetical protein